ncbi:hypothetical protein [Saltwater crocodilepox virus]|nr:hypothetical protein [Saltwater crocodilepox virus]AVD69448.1 hypothetical protein [Saltwater crocodilepox virus]
MAFLPRARLVRLRMQWSMAFAMGGARRRGRRTCLRTRRRSLRDRRGPCKNTRFGGTR